MSEGDAEPRRVTVLERFGVSPSVQLTPAKRRLIAYLAVRGRAALRSVVAADLWPDVPDEAARAHLRQTLWRMPEGWLRTIGDELHLVTEADLPEAKRVAAAALSGQPLQLAEIHLLSCDVLPGWHDEWVIGAQESFRILRVQALEAACRTMANTNLHPLAILAGTAALSAEPLRESAAEALIMAHLAQRNRFEAVQCLQSLAARLDHELGVAPDPTLMHRLFDGGPHAPLAQ
jgi:DNA-binding SARP family transcriptional activator